MVLSLTSPPIKIIPDGEAQLEDFHLIVRIILLLYYIFLYDFAFHDPSCSIFIYKSEYLDCSSVVVVSPQVPSFRVRQDLVVYWPPQIVSPSML